MCSLAFHKTHTSHFFVGPHDVEIIDSFQFNRAEHGIVSVPLASLELDRYLVVLEKILRYMQTDCCLVCCLKSDDLMTCCQHQIKSIDIDKDKKNIFYHLKIFCSRFWRNLELCAKTRHGPASLVSLSSLFIQQVLTILLKVQKWLPLP